MSILDGIAISPNSRFSIRKNPDVAPGVCAVCKHSGGDGRLFVDFGMQLDWYGAVYFCSECVRELCESIGFVPQLSLDISKEISQAAIAALQGVQEQFDDFRRASAGLLRYCTCGLNGRGDRSIDRAEQLDREDGGTQGKNAGSNRKPDKAGSS